MKLINFCHLCTCTDVHKILIDRILWTYFMNHYKPEVLASILKLSLTLLSLTLLNCPMPWRYDCPQKEDESHTAQGHIRQILNISDRLLWWPFSSAHAMIVETLTIFSPYQLTFNHACQQTQYCSNNENKTILSFYNCKFSTICLWQAKKYKLNGKLKPNINENTLSSS